ncbi:Catenin-beta-like protein [Chytridium lagenaria]|nr:Catenin-beta-like protein [Chytridium lagenaria]
MDVSSLFKVPAVPNNKKGIVSNKRKLPSEPSDTVLKRLKGDSDLNEQESKGFSWGVGVEAGNASSSSNAGDDESRFYGDGLSDKQRSIIEIVDAGEEHSATISLQGLKRLVLKLEKAINRNQELRMRHADDPLKFIDSEADLDDEITALSKVSASPNLYPHLVSLGAVSSITSLMSHENTDIAIASINLLNELTDEDMMTDAEEEEEEGLKALVAALMENQILELLVQNLERFNENSDETDDKQGVFSSLGVFENLIAADPNIAELAIDKTTLLSWLLKRISVKGFDSNRQYASELLSVLLQSSRKNRLALNEAGGVATLLKAVFYYKRRDPQEADEIEMMENFFDILCSSLAEPEVKETFLVEEGLELMLMIIREKKMARMRALKVIDHALLGDSGKSCCAKFIEVLGLKAIFPIFMKKGQRSYKKQYKGYSEVEEEEHLISIIFSLIKSSTDKTHLQRIFVKFAESDFEKLRQLFDMNDMYRKRVERAEREMGDMEDDDLNSAEEIYLKKLEKGLFTLQLINLVVCILSVQDIEVTVSFYLFFGFSFSLFWTRGILMFFFF